MNALRLILPFLLIVGGFVGMALALPATGWAVLVGFLCYPFSVETTKRDGDNEPKTDE